MEIKLINFELKHIKCHHEKKKKNGENEEEK